MYHVGTSYDYKVYRGRSDRRKNQQFNVGDGMSVDPPLCRGSSQGFHGSCTKRLDCEGENDWKVGEAGERELVLVVCVRCRKERDTTRGRQTIF